MREPFSFNSFYLLVLRKITNSVSKTTIFLHGGKSQIFFFAICTWPNWPVTAKILSRFQFEGKTDVWINQVRRVNLRLISDSFFIFLQFLYGFRDYQENVIGCFYQVSTLGSFLLRNDLQNTFINELFDPKNNKLSNENWCLECVVLVQVKVI